MPRRCLPVAEKAEGEAMNHPRLFLVVAPLWAGLVAWLVLWGPAKI